MSYEVNKKDILKDVDDEFFIIDSNNLNLVKSKLYGFIISGGKVLENDDLSSEIVSTNLGSYVYVNKVGDTIKITQDFNGCYGLYVFKKDDEFVISNSFLKLLDYVKESYVLTFNKDYADAYISCGLASLAYEETLINEIMVLPKYYFIEIDVVNKQLSYGEIQYDENTVPISSERGMKLLDDWFYRWIEVIRSLNVDNISFDLSGGYDTRLALLLLLSANIDLSNVHVNSINNLSHKEDYEIASEIAEEFGFQLNESLPIRFQVNNEICLKNSLFIKLGIHKQFYYRHFCNLEPLYTFTGYGGEAIRYHWVSSDEEFINAQQKRAANKSLELVDPTISTLKRTFSRFNEIPHFRDNPNGLPDVLNREVLTSNHVGRGTVENYLVNTYNISPLLDPDLNKLKLYDDITDDKNLLIAVIFTRYFPKLLDFKIDGGRFIEESTIEYAKQLNNQYPFDKKEFAFIRSTNKVNEFVEDTNQFEEIGEDPLKVMENIFSSRKFKKLFECIYSEELYQDILHRMKYSNITPFEDVHAAISIVYVFNAVEYSLKNKISLLNPWFNNFSNDSSLQMQDEKHNILSDSLKKYCTARIDIKNKGNEFNSVEIIDISDYLASYHYPQWFNNNGRGLIIQSSNGELNLKIQCLGDGDLDISIRGIDYRNDFGDRIPIYINFKEVSVKNIHDVEKIVWHDEPHNYSFSVVDGEIIDLNFKWEPI